MITLITQGHFGGVLSIGYAKTEKDYFVTKSSRECYSTFKTIPKAIVITEVKKEDIKNIIHFIKTFDNIKLEMTEGVPPSLTWSPDIFIYLSDVKLKHLEREGLTKDIMEQRTVKVL